MMICLMADKLRRFLDHLQQAPRAVHDRHEQVDQHERRGSAFQLRQGLATVLGANCPKAALLDDVDDGRRDVAVVFDDQHGGRLVPPALFPLVRRRGAAWFLWTFRSTGAFVLSNSIRYTSRQ